MLIAAGITDINVALSVWTAVTFAILIVVLGKFAWGPILQMMETREKTIADAIESAKKERAAAEAASAEMRAALEKARNESAELIRRNQQEVAAAKGELMAAAKKESDDLLAAARKTIQEEKRQAIAELRALTVDMAIEAANRLVQMNMDEKKQKQLVEEYISSLPKESRA
ncbi:MAG: F0F1 ATP synthase subunit B [Myxococcales bacterium]|nr:F0F1 ATP synthase subunit B [Myxococcales bacterium]